MLHSRAASLTATITWRDATVLTSTIGGSVVFFGDETFATGGAEGRRGWGAYTHIDVVQRRACSLSRYSCLPVSVSPCLLLPSRPRSHERFHRSIGQFFNRTHKICLTAMLQDDGFSDASSVTVNQLHIPSLNGSLALGGFNQPACRGGVDLGRLDFPANLDHRAK